MYSSHPPEKGATLDDIVSILWPDDRVTKSRVVWYGDKTRSEYRLTRFGRRFPFLTKDRVGDLFVLVPTGRAQFRAYVFDSEDEISDVLSALGVALSDGWGVYRNGVAVVEDPAACEARELQAFSSRQAKFPTGDVFSDQTVTILGKCYPKLANATADDRLLRAMDVEYRLFRAVEQRVCGKEVTGPFASVDDFLRIAASIMGRRKSRAGRSLENHVGKALEHAGINHELRAKEVQGVPDLVIPGVAQYLDLNYPREKVFVVGVKTTCKDRWRQVLNEGPLLERKHLLTVQPGISAAQVHEMVQAKVTLVVPSALHTNFAPDARRHLMSVEGFFKSVQRALDA